MDDEPDALRMITTVLESAEISVLVATSGQAAIDLLEHIVPDLILMDAVMPGLDGFETTVLIKANPAY
ncbi:response regulator, partial [Mycobacterium tuberculosis]